MPINLASRTIATAHGLSVDPVTRRVCLGDRLINLTPTEFNLLGLLYHHEDQVLTHEQIAEWVWGANHFMDRRAIEVQISRLRAKLGESGGHPHLIQTVRGIGYRFIKADHTGVIASFKWNQGLILVEAKIYDESVLDFHAEEILGTPYVVPAKPWVDMSLDSRIEWMYQLFDLHMRHWDGPFMLETRDKSARLVERCTHLLEDHGELVGVETELRFQSRAGR